MYKKWKSSSKTWNVFLKDLPFSVGRLTLVVYDGGPTTQVNFRTEASTYGSGSINATFASDILRLQDLWTGIMWSLLSPLSRVLITIIYAFTVSPQATEFSVFCQNIPCIRQMTHKLKYIVLLSVACHWSLIILVWIDSEIQVVWNLQLHFFDRRVFGHLRQSKVQLKRLPPEN